MELDIEGHVIIGDDRRKKFVHPRKVDKYTVTGFRSDMDWRFTFCSEAVKLTQLKFCEVYIFGPILLSVNFQFFCNF